MTERTMVRVAGVLGFLGVALGAFGAHGLEELLERNGRVGTWETAVFYHLVHAVALLVVARRPGPPQVAGWAMVAGVVVFSGSLYALCLSNLKWLGAITPLGGVALLVGWAALVIGAGRGASNIQP